MLVGLLTHCLSRHWPRWCWLVVAQMGAASASPSMQLHRALRAWLQDPSVAGLPGLEELTETVSQREVAHSYASVAAGEERTSLAAMRDQLAQNAVNEVEYGGPSWAEIR